jgi:phage-related protein
MIRFHKKFIREIGARGVNLSTGGLLLAVGALITGITLLVMYFTSGTDDMAESTGILATAWGYLKAAFYAVAIPVAYGVGYLVGVLTNAWNTVAAYTAEVWPMIKQVVLGAWNAVMTLLGPALNVLSAWFTTAWTSIKIVVTAVWDAIGLTISTIWNGVYNTIAAVWNLISGLFKAALQVLTGDWSGAWETIQNTFAAVWENIKGIFQGVWEWLTGLGDIFLNAGKGLINAFWDGIVAAWEGLKAGFSDLLQGLRDLLPFSDAAAGPLSELTKSGRTLLPTFARGIAQTSDVPAGVVSKSLSRIALDAPVMPGMPSVNLQPPRIPPLQLDAPGLQGAPAPVPATAADSSAGVVFERGAITVTVTGASALDDLEERLTEIFSRASLRLGVSHG